MIPYSYNMVDMGGIDLAEANGTVVDGLYAKIVEAVNACGDIVFYNWKFAGIEITPQYTSILLGNPIIINGAVQVTEQDLVTVPGINPDPPVLVNLTAVENGEYRPVDYDADGFGLVEVDVPFPPPVLQRLDATSNGIYYPPTGVDGYSPVSVNVPTASVDWNDQFSVNWDFSNPVNTRGNTSYIASGSWMPTIDGWGALYASIELVNGGIRLTRNGAGASWSNQGYLEQKYKSGMTNAMEGKQVTLSVIIDGVLGYATETLTSGTGDKLSMTVNGVTARIYNYGTEIAVTLDIKETSHIVQAVKLEAGNQQSLARQIDGVWVLNNTIDHAGEYIKARSGIVYYT